MPEQALFGPVLLPLAIPSPEAENQKTKDEGEAGVAQDFGRKHVGVFRNLVQASLGFRRGMPL